MKLSYNWLKQYIDMDVDPQELSRILTDIGLEVEGLEKFQSVKGGLEGIVIGEVLTCERHANADKLSVTTVKVGDKVLPIVCGAPNVAKGQKVLVATVGTTLYDGDNEFKIKKSKIRGEVSEGMICAEDELGLGTSHDGIMVLGSDAPVGKPAKDYINIEEDWVYEIGLTPNRADAASHIGSARDLVAGLNWLKSGNYKLNIPSVDNFKVDNHDLDIDIEVEDTEACPRYTGVTISGITVEESPEWLKNRLNAIGIRPINNIVDITNFVLHETGHPLHAFDAAKIKGNKVVVKKLPSETPFVTLDEMERKLHADDLMICNVEEGMCIAGVFGGAESGVTGNTTSIFLESAYFDPTHIRKTSKRHVLQTDASFRFERGADPNITEYALKRAALLIKDIAGGQISSEIKDVYPKTIEKWTVDISFDRVTRLIGKEIEKDTIVKILEDLDIEVLATSHEGLKLLIPTFKVDVRREVDIVEEILRVYGYNNIEIPEKVNSSVSLRQKPDLERIQNMVADYLVGQGFTEIMNNSLTKAAYIEKSAVFDQDHSVELLNPLSTDLNIMRQTLLFGGLEVINYNQNRKINDLKIFEFGKIYKRKSAATLKTGVENYFEEKHLALFTTGKMEAENWNSRQVKTDFYTAKGIVESIIKRLGIDRKKITMIENSSDDFAYTLDYVVNDNVVVSVGEVSKKLLKSFDIKQPVYVADFNWDKIINLIPARDLTYRAISKFPAVRRDLALIVDKAVTFESLKQVASKAERKILKEVGIFDIYEGDKIPEGKKSYALSFVLQDENKTLTDKIIDKAMRRIQQALETEAGAQLR
ncbi:MAG: phenylalanine--tRNA ligase subunit beta [Bacteroidetes bacterium]|nr:MAG: phenylalanine--tRNA ligase subunit beta [Bacteroidota bacterium]